MTPRNQQPTPDPKPWPIDKPSLRAEGDRRRDEGMALAAYRSPDKIQVAQVAMLERLLTSPDGTATIDDATEDLTAEFRDGGNWRGSVVRNLALKGVIEKVGVEVSNRPSRHRGYIARWRLVDRSKAIALRNRLKGEIENLSNKSKTPSANSSPKVADGASNGFNPNKKD